MNFQGEVILPADLMMKHTLQRSTVLKGPKSEEEKRALQDTVQVHVAHVYLLFSYLYIHAVRLLPIVYVLYVCVTRTWPARRGHTCPR